MLKNYLKSSLLIVLIFSIQSCGDDDKSDDYIPIVIETSPDLAVVVENSAIEIDVLSNDTNVPTSGSLVTSNAANGTIEVLDINNTPNTPSDDMVLYTPNTDFVGTDTFTYTICNNLDPISCSTEDVSVTVTPELLVVYNPEDLPYQTLSEYNFFVGDLKNLDPIPGVLPYDLNSPLFSDYAHKKRFVWMPDGTTANYNSDFTPLDFPVGAMLIKNFFYDNVQPENTTRIVETRLMYMTEEGWDFAKYVWDDEQTEATFTNDGSFIEIDWIENGATNSVNYRIPSRNECFTCHNKFGTPLPIGPKPQNLNKEYNYTDGALNQLSKWVDVGYLESNVPATIVSTVDWEDDSLSLELRVRSYLDINCAHCHSEESYCEYRPLRLAFNENDDDVNKGVCVTPDTQISPYTHIISSGQIDKSILHFRISSIEEQNRMPLLGRTLQHTEGVRLIEEWINSLEGVCE
ncbi:Ig-like domain-containing protein [Psychroserpens jangbogonensis]|uniref:Ig-like domain-containing protein n=1 Tax=Psychroserpens jangbogonensis TaxID=1484460 RepID=UPI00053D2741|nr:Ig-like domain-containing protein [Psychroserpens jangbogonensis]